MKTTLACAFVIALVGCGPKMVDVKPQDVKSAVVRPISGLPEFCPGQPFQVELVVELSSGERCSSVVPGPCMGSSKALLDPKQIVVQSPLGSFEPQGNMMAPVDDVFATATGMMLQGWIVGAEGKKATTTLKPVYRCMQSNVYAGGAGMPGEAGPTLDVAATVVRTPYYPRATLVRIGSPWGVRYVMAPAGQRIAIVARGGDGMQGAQGSSGSAGVSGAAGPTCGSGGAGGPGGNGGPGGPGGDGGPGGAILARIDAAAFDEIASVLDLDTPGGDGGSGGSGGSGGAGGAGGAAGASDEKQCPSGGSAGPRGSDGSAGPSGQPGRDGGAGIAPRRIPAAREQLFAGELGKIQGMEK